MALQRLISPKQAARAIGVSESSLKRWCDRGLIATERTGGGHRRLSIDAFMTFVRDRGFPLVEPSVIGLPELSGVKGQTLAEARDLFRKSLVAGDDESCRRIVHDLYLAPHSLGAICDEVIAGAFNDIGNLWSCGEVEVYEERRACEIAARVLHEFRMLVPPPPPAAELAIGGSPEGDPYSLATTMAELVLRTEGWRAVSLGNMLPFDSIVAAVVRHEPALVWVSVSVIADEAEFISGMSRIQDEVQGIGGVLVGGGRALTPEIRKRIRLSSYCDTLQNLETFARAIRARRTRQPAAAREDGQLGP
jgi:excisionase family DNA binding protein